MCFKLYVYILKKKDNKSQPKEVNLRKTLEQNCVFIQAKPHNYVLIYSAQKEGLLISCLRSMKRIYIYIWDFVYLDRLMEVEWWMPCFWMSQILLTLWF